MNNLAISSTMGKKKIITVFAVLTALFLFSTSAVAQVKTSNVGEIVGKVRSIDTHEALIGVNVYLEKTIFGASTDSKGIPELF